MADSKRTLTPEAAAALVGLSVEELIAQAGDGRVPGAILTAFGWRFDLGGIRHLAERLGRTGPDDGGAAA
jgi:hypothetical protein